MEKHKLTTSELRQLRRILASSEACKVLILALTKNMAQSLIEERQWWGRVKTRLKVERGTLWSADIDTGEITQRIEGARNKD